jgi:hypothetical protein
MGPTLDWTQALRFQAFLSNAGRSFVDSASISIDRLLEFEAFSFLGESSWHFHKHASIDWRMNECGGIIHLFGVQPENHQ